MEKLKIRIRDILGKHKKGDKLSIIYDILSITLILLSVSFIIVETFPIPHLVHEIIFIIELAIAILFSIEYLLRIWIAPLDYPSVSPLKARIRYIFSFMSLIDLLAIIPVFFVNIPNATGILKIFKLCKILRLIKVGRYFGGISTLKRAFKKKFKEIIFSVIVILVLIVLCSVCLYWSETQANSTEFKHGFSGILHSLDLMFGNQSNVVLVTEVGKTLLRFMLVLSGCFVGIPTTIFIMGIEEAREESIKALDEKDRIIKEIQSLDKEEQLKIIDAINKLLTK